MLLIILRYDRYYNRPYYYFRALLITKTKTTMNYRKTHAPARGYIVIHRSVRDACLEAQERKNNNRDIKKCNGTMSAGVKIPPCGAASA